MVLIKSMNYSGYLKVIKFLFRNYFATFQEGIVF
ncbi:hypothetical protein CO998_02329 [Enterococcus faecium]|nr:hypothetical protein CO993_02324 [Enterococcus faecium]AUI19540.1 hypothetical protein CO994_02331 [Enterococcus faecium]AUI22508.1 hypothetical protein CO995_02329 [Enterococcus faecium]AUI25480.1 hypothetical protein CO996_02330 [Enterococcus faecium]AUI28454.1 hypothetical protein CO998_02329 [Enterococcus faecium]